MKRFRCSIPVAAALIAIGFVLEFGAAPPARAQSIQSQCAGAVSQLLNEVGGLHMSFQTVPTPAFPLSAGTHVLRIVSDQAYFNLETIDVIRSQ